MTNTESDDDTGTEPPESPESPEKKRRSDVYEIIATVLLGVATVAIAWSANQSNLWSGIQDKKLAESVRVSNESVDALQNADSVQLLDRVLFIELLGELEGEDESAELSERATEIISNMSPEGADATAAWADGEVEFPFDDEVYVEALFSAGEDLQVLSDELYDEGAEANSNGDNYVLASTMMATVLFFAGISMVLSGITTRRVLLAVASLALVGSIGFMLTLPVA